MHRSLIKPKPYEEPSTKPLIDKKELEEMTRDYLLKEVDRQMIQIAHEETTMQQLLHATENMTSILLEIRDAKNETSALKLEVLQKLKHKLETTT